MESIRKLKLKKKKKKKNKIDLKSTGFIILI